jgi:hypothetical protein
MYIIPKRNVANEYSTLKSEKPISSAELRLVAQYVIERERGVAVEALNICPACYERIDKSRHCQSCGVRLV